MNVSLETVVAKAVFCDILDSYLVIHSAWLPGVHERGRYVGITHETNQYGLKRELQSEVKSCIFDAFDGRDGTEVDKSVITRVTFTDLSVS